MGEGSCAAMLHRLRCRGHPPFGHRQCYMYASMIRENRRLVDRLTFKTSGRGYDEKDEGQDAQGYTNRGDVVVAVLFGDALTVHALAQ